METTLNVREFSNISMIKGPLMVVKGVTDAGYNELVEIEMENGEKRRGIVVDSQLGMAVVQVFEGTTGISPTGTNVKFLGRGLEVKISDEMLGRVFNPLGEPLDNGPPVISGEKRDING
ncbi:MAG: V-type ATP synthase subunit B, partial [Acidianus infernus]|nr:V-type ATP synthase subunit B [Acidianus infernus]